MMQEIDKVIEEKVLPYLQNHGGGVELLGLEDGVLKVRLLGQCSGCPSATITTEQIIQEEVCAAVPQVKQVVLVQGVSDDLIAQARAMMKHHE